MSDCISESVEVSIKPPLVLDGTPPACGVDTQVSAACADPEYALDHPDECPNSSPFASLAIVPSSGSIEVASSFGYRAVATFESLATKDVTDSAVWSTDNVGIAAIFSPGLVTGIGVGTATVTATWRGKLATATLTVTAQCIQYGLDVAVVVSRSASMNLCDDDPGCVLSNGRTRLVKAKQAVKNMLANLTATDQVTVISFGGIIQFPDGGSVTKLPDTRFETVLTTDRSIMELSIDQIVSNTPCSTATALNCASGIGSGIALATQELTGPRARTGQVKKVMIVVTDGVENICVPDPVTASDAAKTADILIIMVAIDVPEVEFQDCDDVTQTSHEYLVNLASFGLAYFEDSDDLANIFSRIPNIICEGGYGYGYYYYNVPPDHHYLDQLDYTGFINWNVDYCVDLVGRDLWVFPSLAGHGAYVDLCGTSCPHPGGINLKTPIALGIGNYRFSIQVAGNQRTDYSAKGGDRVKIIITSGLGSAPHILNETITILNKNQGFTTYQFEFNLTSPEPGAIIQINEIPFEIAWQTQSGAVLPVVVGALIDEVLLDNLSAAPGHTVVFYDNFNLENPA